MPAVGSLAIMPKADSALGRGLPEPFFSPRHGRPRSVPTQLTSFGRCCKKCPPPHPQFRPQSK
eukprot:7877974-Alexandrium_andersonii.AAC.1